MTALHDLIRETAIEFLSEGRGGAERNEGREDAVLTLLDKTDPILNMLSILEAERRQTTVGSKTPDFITQTVDNIQTNFPGDHLALAKMFDPDQRYALYLRDYRRTWARMAAMGAKYPFSVGVLGPKTKVSSNQNVFIVVGSPESVLAEVGGDETKVPVGTGDLGIFVSHQTDKRLQESEIAALSSLVTTAIGFSPVRLRGCIMDETDQTVPLAFMSKDGALGTCADMGRDAEIMPSSELHGLLEKTYLAKPTAHTLTTYVGFSIPRL